jgi:hypothetical protein
LIQDGAYGRLRAHEDALVERMVGREIRPAREGIGEDACPQELGERRRFHERIGSPHIIPDHDNRMLGLE